MKALRWANLPTAAEDTEAVDGRGGLIGGLMGGGGLCR
jgi:hypothetical protein